MKKNPYQFFDKLVVRIPRLPHSDGLSSTDFLKSQLENPVIAEAIFLASESTYYKALKWKNGEDLPQKDLIRLKNTLTKYLIRMSNRCTPFGLFAGCGIVNWSPSDDPIIVSPETELSKHTRIDTEIVDQIKNLFFSFEAVKNGLRYYPNSTIYKTRDKLRYTEYLVEKNKRKHIVSKVDTNEYLERILKAANQGATISTLSNSIVMDDIVFEDAREFVLTLIREKILISELDLSTTRPDNARTIIQIVDKIALDTKDNQLKEKISAFNEIFTEINKIDLQKSPSPQNYIHVRKKLQAFLNSKESFTNVLQTDLTFPVASGGLNERYQRDILEVISVLNKLNGKRDIKMEEFAKKFFRKYGDAEIPLMEALDPDLGIGYKNYNTESFGNNPLLDSIIIADEPAQNEFLVWNKIEAFLHEKYQTALRNDSYEVTIENSELKGFEQSWEDLPETITLNFSHIGKIDGEDRLNVRFIGGINGSYLLGRFAFADQQIHDFYKAITDFELKSNPEVVLADVNHVPQLRDVNIMIHPNLYGAEIAYLAQENDPKVERIPLSDLMVSVHNMRVYLRSKKLDRRIIPRINTAHNYHQGVSHHIYSFLGDLQYQGFRPGIPFDWDALSSRETFLPRVRIKSIIVSPAKWRFLDTDIPFLQKEKPLEISAVKDWRKKWRIPRFVELVENRDNKLKLDLTDLTHIDLIKTTLDKFGEINLEEFLFDAKNSLVKGKNDEPYRNEFLTALYQERTEKNRKAQLKINNYMQLQKIDPAVQRDFYPGSEWVFYELYCGFASSDSILSDYLSPLAHELKKNGIINKWFFIRYNVPRYHIRLRFHLNKRGNMGVVMLKMSTLIDTLMKSRIISKNQITTYQRELERYGSLNIERSESIFYNDSAAITKLLPFMKSDLGEESRWLIALKNVHEFTNDLDWNLDSKIELFESLSQSFGKEFNMDKVLRKQLNGLYRQHTKSIEGVLEEKMDDQKWKVINTILNERSHKNKVYFQEIIALHQSGELEVSIQSLTSSYVHMTLNRLFKSRPRLQEMIVYYILHKYYRAYKARMKKKAQATVQ